MKRISLDATKRFWRGKKAYTWLVIALSLGILKLRAITNVLTNHERPALINGFSYFEDGSLRCIARLRKTATPSRCAVAIKGRNVKSLQEPETTGRRFRTARRAWTKRPRADMCVQIPMGGIVEKQPRYQFRA